MWLRIYCSFREASAFFFFQTDLKKKKSKKLGGKIEKGVIINDFRNASLDEIKVGTSSIEKLREVYICVCVCVCMCVCVCVCMCVYVCICKLTN